LNVPLLPFTGEKKQSLPCVLSLSEVAVVLHQALCLSESAFTSFMIWLAAAFSFSITGNFLGLALS
jgi:hypothetical protein